MFGDRENTSRLKQAMRKESIPGSGMRDVESEMIRA